MTPTEPAARRNTPRFGLVQPLLVRDPQHKSKIESGRQLFGNVTWWMFWRNGYQALAALDDTMDGLPAANSLGFHSGSTGIKTAPAILAK